MFNYKKKLKIEDLECGIMESIVVGNFESCNTKKSSKFRVRSLFMIFGIVLFILSASTMVVSKDQSFTISYNPEVQGVYEKMVDYSSFMIKIQTTSDSICKYDLENVSYGSMENVFDETGGKIHRKSFVDLGDGNYRYYIKCKNFTYSLEPKDLTVVIRVNDLVKAQIVLDQNSPLKNREVGVKLVTSKYISNTPSLTYSVDGISYKPLVLVGSGNIWHSSLVLEKTLEEGVLSFKFKGNDLEGRQGEEITSGAFFDFDFVKPKMITDIKAESYEGKIELFWHINEEIDVFKIYRSELANPGNTDEYKTVSNKKFVDTNVEKGKTYYYKISAVDYAGNEGDLSKEVSGTSLSSTEDNSYGLNPQLVGIVDSFLSEIEALILDISSIKSSIETKTTEEKYLFEKMGMNSKINKAENELVSLRNSVAKYKDQDLSREDLVLKIDSSRVKLGILEKDIPENIRIDDSFEKKEDLSVEKQNLALLEISSILDEKQKEKSLKETARLVKEDSLSVKSLFYDVDVSYLDGKKENYFVVKREISSKFEGLLDSYFVERVSSSVSGDFDSVKILNRNYDVVKEGGVFTFPFDTKEIVYFIPAGSNFRSMENIEFSFIKIVKENSASVGITGFSIFENGGYSYFGVILGIIIILIIFYFSFSKNNYSDDYFRAVNRINDCRDEIDKRNFEKAGNLYTSVKRLYSGLKQGEKKKIYSDVEEVYVEILVNEIQGDLEKYSLIKGDSTSFSSKKEKLILEIDKKIKKLPKDKREKILPLFEKIKSGGQSH